jgi:hypothetical protein
MIAMIAWLVVHVARVAIWVLLAPIWAPWALLHVIGDGLDALDRISKKTHGRAAAVNGCDQKGRSLVDVSSRLLLR